MTYCSEETDVEDGLIEMLQGLTTRDPEVFKNELAQGILGMDAKTLKDSASKLLQTVSRGLEVGCSPQNVEEVRLPEYMHKYHLCEYTVLSNRQILSSI